MALWSDGIAKQLEGVDMKSVIEPPVELKPIDHIVGEANPELRQLWGLVQQLERRASEALIPARYDPSEEKRELYIAKAREYRVKAALVLEIFWATIKDTYDLWDKCEVGIRQGWKIVWSDCQHGQQDGIPDFLRRFLQG